MTTWTPEMESEFRSLLIRAYRAHGYERAVAACRGKHAFHNAKCAEAALPKRDWHGRPSIYHCKSCGWWHIGGGRPPSLGAKKPPRIIGSAAALGSEE